MTEVEEFIYGYEGDDRSTLLYFDHIFVNELNLTSKIRFNIPFYYGKRWICYLNPKKNGGIELSNAQGLLNAKGRKQVLSIEFENVKNIPEELIMEVIHEALLLDETKPYASKNRKK